MGEKFEVLKAEFKKIIWPDQKRAGKETVVVLVSGVLISAIVALLDMVIKFGLSFIL